MSGESSSFCVVPWLHRMVDERGFLKVCCVAEGAANFLTDEHGQRFHVQGAASEREILNSPTLKSLRRKMLHGEWDAMCARCLNAESAGAGSSRTGRNNHFRHHIPTLLAATDADGAVLNPSIRHVDLRLGNYCNLTCRMCSPGASKLWLDPFNRVQPEGYTLSDDRLLALRNIAWVDDPHVWQKFRDLLPSVEWLHFAGGEPMMIPEMIHVLQLCVDAGCAGAIDLSYTTNITLLPDAVADLWPRFKSVSLSCSVDGFGALNEYIRRPSHWQDVDRHLHTLDRHFREWNLREVLVTTTVQVYNILDLDKLYAYLRSDFAHVLPAPLLNPLTFPPYLSVATLPASIKEIAVERLRLEQTRTEYRDARLAWLLASIDTIVQHMRSEDLSRHWPDFLTFTERSDREFRDSFAAAAPELAGRLAGALK